MKKRSAKTVCMFFALLIIFGKIYKTALIYRSRLAVERSRQDLSSN